MSKFFMASGKDDKGYHCDNCTTNKGALVINWPDKDFSLCLKCLLELTVQHLFPLFKHHEGIQIRRKTVSERIRNKIFKRDKRKCKHCGSTKDLCLDHIIPFALNGKTTEDNLQVLCKTCNGEKGMKYV